jgi:hypothetical protein
MTFLYCCSFEHAYRAVAWQWFGQIRYNRISIVAVDVEHALNESFALRCMK